MAKLMEEKVETVGGLFQIALLGRQGIRWVEYESPSQAGCVALKIENDEFVQYDKDKDRAIPLKPIWEWYADWEAQKHMPGNIGTFEDPGLRKATEDSSE